MREECTVRSVRQDLSEKARQKPQMALSTNRTRRDLGEKLKRDLSENRIRRDLSEKLKRDLCESRIQFRSAGINYIYLSASTTSSIKMSKSNVLSIVSNAS